MSSVVLSSACWRVWKRRLTLFAVAILGWTSTTRPSESSPLWISSSLSSSVIAEYVYIKKESKAGKAYQLERPKRCVSHIVWARFCHRLHLRRIYSKQNLSIIRKHFLVSKKRRKEKKKSLTKGQTTCQVIWARCCHRSLLRHIYSN